MNRRDFLKRIAAAGLVAAAPEVLVPERRFWQLDRMMAMPSRIPGNDTAWVQWHLDHGLQVPGGWYDMHDAATLRNLRNGHFEPFAAGCRFTIRGDGPCLIVDPSCSGTIIDCNGAQWDYRNAGYVVGVQVDRYGLRV